jgi:hypothetical protein
MIVEYIRYKVDNKEHKEPSKYDMIKLRITQGIS